MSNIYNVEFEKILLSYIIKDYTILGEIPTINEKDFTPNVNRIVFQAIQACLASDKKNFSKFILIEKLNTLNIKIGDDILPATYINALDLLGRDVSAEAAIGVAKKIKAVTVRRSLNQAAQKIMDMTKVDDGSKTIDLVNSVNQVFNKQINIIEEGTGNEPIDLFATAEQNIEHNLGVGDKKDVIPPYDLYSDMYGSFDAGGLHVYCSRMGIGKSTWLMNILEKTISNDDNLIALLLDSELEGERVQRRMISSLSGVNEYFLRNGTYRNNSEMYEKVKIALKRVGPWSGKLYHHYIGGVPLESQISFCKRWYEKYVSLTGKKAIIAVDYFKMGSIDNYNSQMKDYQMLGVKADAYKQLATELEIPIIAAVQTNRTNTYNGFGSKVENSSIVAGSDEIARVCSNLFLLQQLSVDEKLSFGEPDAALTLKALKTRQLGPNNKRLNNLVKYMDNGRVKFCENYLVYSNNYFNIKEMCSFQDIVKKNDNKIINVNMNNAVISNDNKPKF